MAAWICGRGKWPADAWGVIVCERKKLPAAGSRTASTACIPVSLSLWDGGYPPRDLSIIIRMHFLRKLEKSL